MLVHFTLYKAAYNVGVLHIVWNSVWCWCISHYTKQCMMLVHFALYKAVYDVSAFCIVQSNLWCWCVLPWHDLRGWLGVKNPIDFLHSLLMNFCRNFWSTSSPPLWKSWSQSLHLGPHCPPVRRARQNPVTARLWPSRQTSWASTGTSQTRATLQKKWRLSSAKWNPRRTFLDSWGKLKWQVQMRFWMSGVLVCVPLGCVSRLFPEACLVGARLVYSGRWSEPMPQNLGQLCRWPHLRYGIAERSSCGHAAAAAYSKLYSCLSPPPFPVPFHHRVGQQTIVKILFWSLHEHQAFLVQ